MVHPALLLMSCLIALVIVCFLVFLVVRAAMVSALRQAGPNLAATNELLRLEVDLTGRLARHLAAQSELMVLVAKHDGIADPTLAPVLRQLDEHPAGSHPGLPYQ